LKAFQNGMLSLFLRMRKTIHFSVLDLGKFRDQCLSWASGFDHFALLDSNTQSAEINQNLIPTTYDMLIASGSLSAVVDNCHLSFLQTYINEISDWSFGHLGFNLEAETEGIKSRKKNKIGFPDLFFFQPKWVITVKNNLAELLYPNTVAETEAISELNNILKLPKPIKKITNTCKIHARCKKDQYLYDISQLQKHINRGDIYEVNYCIEFYDTKSEIDPYNTYLALQDYSPAPFSAFYKYFDKFLLSSSPERYLKKTGRTIISQPIKGTIARGKSNADDEKKKNELIENPKERNENIMITDLVRNDLSRVATPGTVKVEELCGVYSYKYVHQLISTVSAELSESQSAVNAIFQTFPMGSMTGAPKHSSLKLINKYEHFNRGLFSGSVGYFNPFGDFDFNVVIRSILYNQTQKHLSIPAGSAITANSMPEKEYEECMLKANALIQVLKQSSEII
jgi:para-aminobenzoate synthetase component 1